MLATLLLWIATPQQAQAKLVMMTPAGATVINYPTMQRCLAAKQALLRQFRERADEDRARTGVIVLSGPTVYCLPS